MKGTRDGAVQTGVVGDLAAANEALSAANMDLEQAKKALRQLNHQLDTQLQTSTRQLQLAQAEAHRQRERLERFLMQAPAAICVLSGPDLVYELVNPGYEQLFPGRSLLGRPVLEALPEFVGRPNAVMLQNVYLTGQTFHGRELPVLLARQEGGEPETRYFNFTYQARCNDRGQVDGILVFAYEVTPQVLARKEMEKNARQLRLITDAMPVLIGYLDKEEKYRFANHAYQSWFNQDPQELLGRTVREVAGEKAYAGVKKYIEQALSGEKVTFEAMMPYRDNLVKYIRTSYVPDKQQGEVVGFFTLGMDITDQRKSEEKLQFLTRELAAANQELRVANEQVQATNEELARSNRELTRINEELGRTNVDLDNFIYTASHDLKAPIANIEGFLSALDRRLRPESHQDETVQQIFQMLNGSVNRFKTTIRDLTDVAKISKGDSGDADSLPLAGVLEEVLEDLRPQIQESQARLEIRLDCQMVHFSRKNLKSILYNLLSNALKYRSPDRLPVVTIHCRKQDHYNVLSVQDNGLGIDMRQEEKLFALFKRLHSHVEGTGIGLYIVKRIIENAGGKIEVESKVGAGSTFKVFFPG
jgi:PAS domain S-box-containing protein